jgi:hypothetical protein
MEQTKNKFYLNKAQQYILNIGARNNVIIASRRFGKSEGVIMPVMLRNVQNMPQSTGAIVARSFKQALTRTLPATLHALERLGYIDGVHYFVGRKAPKTSGFLEPKIKPRNWDYCIHWYNGSVNHIISQDIEFSSNSLTLDYWIGDEAKTLNWSKIQNELIPANSGLSIFKNCPWHTGYTLVSDLPDKRAKWLIGLYNQMDKDLISVIEGLIFELYQIQDIASDTKWYKNKIALLKNEINAYRKEATLFVVYSILENLEIVGERYVADMKRQLNPYVFKTAILSVINNTTEGSFYGAFDHDTHTYTKFNNTYLNNYRASDNSIKWKEAQYKSNNCEQDEDINPDEPLYIAFDVNININWLIVGQPDYDHAKLYTINSFYVKHPRMLPELCNEFCDYYETLQNREIVFYFDQTFYQGKSANSSESFAETIIRILTNRGFYVNDVYIGQAWKHNEKHREIDLAFKGFKNLFPKFNLINNEILIEAITRTGTKNGLNGWGKDKSAEKDPDDEANPVEFRTDGTDAWDTLFIGCNFHPVRSSNDSISLTNNL